MAISDDLEFNKAGSNMTYQQVPDLKLDYRLPIISIPENKTIPFLKWYFEDISKNTVKDIPQVFDEGYITIQNIPCTFLNNCKVEYTKYLAHIEGKTYREIETLLKDVYDAMLSNVVMHYKFIDGLADVGIYSSVDSKLMLTIPLIRYRGENENQTLISLGDVNTIEDTVEITDASCATTEKHEFQNKMMIVYLGLFASAMWYMALYKNRYKYEKQVGREDIREVILHRPRPAKVKSTKILTASFYDLSKAPQSKVQTLIKKREGFEYSHQFDVRGHWRHYRDGKVVFIESYTKAKDKPRLQQNIILNPKR